MWARYDGLAITVGAVLTLFAIMQLAGRLDGAEVLRRAPPAPIAPGAGAPSPGRSPAEGEGLGRATRSSALPARPVPGLRRYGAVVTVSSALGAETLPAASFAWTVKV